MKRPGGQQKPFYAVGVAKYEGEGFASPEEAVHTYIDALREQDFAVNEETLLNAAQKKCEQYGCDDLTPTAAKILIDGVSYYIAMDTIKYGEKWYLYGAGLSAAYIGVTTFQYGAIAEADDDLRSH